MSVRLLTGDDAPSRPALRWHGGKWMLAPWIIGHFPKHRVYVEPFGGAASVLLRKERSYAEVYNDLDEHVVGLFRIMRDETQAARLIKALELTPFARDEFLASYENHSDPLEAARRLIVRAFMGHGSDSATGIATVERLRGVIIEKRNAIDVMMQHDAPETLHYVDPPYMHETRSWMTSGKGKGNYRHELSTEDHEQLLVSLRALVGMVVISGYPTPLYDEALHDWRRIETKANADGARPRTEVLWLNPATAGALERSRSHGPLFAQPSTVLGAG